MVAISLDFTAAINKLLTVLRGKSQKFFRRRIGNPTAPGRSYHLDHCHQVPESDSNCPGIEAERSERNTLRRRGPGIAQGIAA